MEKISVKFPPKFKPFFKPARYKIARGGRGSGKSWSIAKMLLIMAASKPLRVLCTREVQKSIKESVKALLDDQIQTLQLGQFYQSLDNEIRGVNGSQFLFAGLASHTVESIKSYEGCDIVWVEEAQSVCQRSWDVLIPTIRKPGSEIWASFNPYLPSDPVWLMSEELQSKDNAVVITINYFDNPWCPPELIAESERMKESDFEKWENIWLGLPKTIADGAIYKAEFEQIRKENRICKVPHDPNLQVYTSWDLGILDSTAIWFFQIYGKEVRVIDYYEANNEPLAHYARILDEKKKEWGYMYEKHFAPHDIAARDLSSGVSREQTMASLGYRMTKGARLGVEDRIEAARQMLKNCWFDADKCSAGIKALQNYRRDYNDKLDQFKATPVHDWASHGSDAFGEGALNINKMHETAKPKPIPQLKRSGWMS